MNIGRQWEDRLKIWAQQLPKFYFVKQGSLPMSYFTTMEHLRFDEAVKGPYTPAPVGTKWGKKWEYGWFRTELTVPRSLQGQRLVFTLNTAEEMLVWVNGREAGAIDKKHRFITLSRSANGGDTYEIVAECYAGHGVRNEGAGPVAWGEESVPEPKAQQITTGESVFGVWNESLFQAAMDYLTLYSLVQKLPPKSLRAMKIIEGLKRFTYLADFELPEPEMTASVVEAGKVLKPLLACKNGSTAPDYTVFGQSHLDLAWLWPVEETMRKSARTYTNQLALMDEYENYQFLLCEPPILEWLKEHYPNVWQRVKEKIASGAFHPEGALWVESDTNIPSGESLIRQFAWGKRWYRKELGVDSKMAWMPDTFGFSAALPQIMKKCQVPYFATQKLIRQDPECQSFPYNVFWWEGMDGSKVLSHTFKKNNANFQAGDLITRWEEDRVQQENIDGLMFPFGFGDGGGGPTRDMVEMANRCADLEGAPRCRMEHPVKYFERLENVENTFRGELYLAWHRGTLTSQTKTKRLIRFAENNLRQLEFFLSWQMLSDKEMPENWQQRLNELWKKLLFNQFHDIAPGTSIERVHQRAEEELRQVCQDSRAMLGEILPDGGPRPITMYNSLGFDRTFRGVTIPAQGSAVVDYEKPLSSAQVRYLEEETCYELSNDHLVCRVNTRGEVVSVKRPGCDREYLAGVGNRFLMFKDVNTCYDAWELGSMYENLPVELDGEVSITMHAYPVKAELEIKGKLRDSAYTQTITLTPEMQFLAFNTHIDWQEKHKLLKVAFPVNTYANEAYHEIQFGYVKRPVHRSYQTDKDRYEVCNHRYTALTDGAHGAAVLNDGKFGVNVVENEIRLTLLRAAMMPDQNADRGLQQFIYAFYPFDGSFQDSDVLQQAMQLNEPMLAGGSCDDLGPIFLSDKKNIIVDTIKPADCYENALLVRVYEAMGKQTDCAFTTHTNVKSIVETDMLEENEQSVDLSNVHFGPFEIKTFILTL
ncbi:MAG: alpha-mannosidase [Oscillospiraceae bacterium]|nr:alpha-mannosidase [Oscillospiraceae bacterium]